MKEIDWTQIKNEYVTTDVSLRELSRRYQVPYTTVNMHYKAESWKRDHDHVAIMVDQKVQESLIDKKAERITKMINATDLLTDRIIDAMQNMDYKNVNALRQLTAALKDIRELYNINKSDLDIEEQKARIANLRKQAAEDDDKTTQITFSFEGGDEAWQK